MAAKASTPAPKTPAKPAARPAAATPPKAAPKAPATPPARPAAAAKPATAPVKAPTPAPAKAPVATVKSAAPATATRQVPVAPRPAAPAGVVKTAAPVAAKAPTQGPGKAAPATAQEKAEVARKSGSEDEFSAAVNGELKPRSTKGAAQQEDLGKRASHGRPSGRPIGVTTGFPVMLCWAYLFQENHKAPVKPAAMGTDGRAKIGSGKMTDEQISAWIKKEYPGRETAAFDEVMACRRLYNQGRFTRGIPPKIKSVGYDSKAQVMADKPLRGAAATAVANSKKVQGTAPVARGAVPSAAPKQTVAAAARDKLMGRVKAAQLLGPKSEAWARLVKEGHAELLEPSAAAQEETPVEEVAEEVEGEAEEVAEDAPEGEEVEEVAEGEEVEAVEGDEELEAEEPAEGEETYEEGDVEEVDEEAEPTEDELAAEEEAE